MPTRIYPNDSFKTTATIQIGSKIQTRDRGFKGVIPHAKRELPNDSNKDIIPELTKYNMSGKVSDYDEVLHYALDGFIKTHDEKQSRNDRKYKDIDGYFNKNKRLNHHIDKPAIFYFGSKDYKEEYINRMHDLNPQYSKESIQDAYLIGVSRGLAQYAKGFNKRNNSIKMGEYVTNVDELGGAHLHAQLMPVTKTKSGKPSFSLNKALAKDFNSSKTPNNVLLSRWRAIEDRQLVSTVNDSLRDVFDGLPHQLNAVLIRTGENGNLTHDQYKASKKLDDKLKEEKGLDASIKAKRAEIAQNQAEEKQELVDTIKQIDPSHKVPKESLDANDDPQPIDSDVGQSQHLNQSLRWLRQTSIDVIQTAKKKSQKMWAKMYQRDQDQTKRDDDLNRKAKALDKQAKTLSEQAKLNNDIAQGNQDVYHRVTTELAQGFTALNNKSIAYNMSYAKGQKSNHGKTQFALLAEMTSEAIRSDDPQRQRIGRLNADRFDRLSDLLKDDHYSDDAYYNHYDSEPDDDNRPDDDGPDLD